MSYKDEPDIWIPISEEDTLEKLEGNAYYRKNTVVKMLKSGKEVDTPYSIYRSMKNE